ncbi:plasmid mobilization protein [Treponema peruense]|uniref:Ribbon-helix-helix protein, copG family n=1 Tax=Treponema peruense TaxID=2787628 RepID=A0A7T3RBH1_9SPIR|nr:hypothetical protein [Treponema peruense]QQA00017.1 hypothetical protein IWA51_06935 [Treponema peruense]
MNNHGGSRHGSGRPKGSLNKTQKEDKKEECIYVRCTTEEKTKLQQLAKENNLSVSKYILEKCFN